MAESRDANDPRKAMRALRREVQEELEGEQQHDTGGQEHASLAERRGEAAAAESPAEAETAREIGRATREQSDAGALAVPRGDAATGGGGNATRSEPPVPDEEGR